MIEWKDIAADEANAYDLNEECIFFDKKSRRSYIGILEHYEDDGFICRTDSDSVYPANSFHYCRINPPN